MIPAIEERAACGFRCRFSARPGAIEIQSRLRNEGFSQPPQQRRHIHVFSDSLNVHSNWHVAGHSDDAPASGMRKIELETAAIDQRRFSMRSDAETKLERRSPLGFCEYQPQRGMRANP